VTECLTACSVYKRTLEDSEADRGYLPSAKPVPYDAMWDELPEMATENEKRLRIVTKTGLWIATGYERIVSIGANRRKFLECSKAQIQKPMFSLYPQEKDGYGVYEMWKSPDGMKVREYKQDDRSFRAGYWYPPLHMLTIAPQATLGDVFRKAG